jgi:mediator of RNA polymerase II transcription subunit 10
MPPRRKKKAAHARRGISGTNASSTPQAPTQIPVTDTSHERVSFLTLTDITPERYEQLVSSIPAASLPPTRRLAPREARSLLVILRYRKSQSEALRVVASGTSLTVPIIGDNRLQQVVESTGPTTVQDTSYESKANDVGGEPEVSEAKDQQPAVSDSEATAAEPQVQNQTLGIVSSGPPVSNQLSGQIIPTVSTLPFRDPSPAAPPNTAVLKSPTPATANPSLPTYSFPATTSAPEQSHPESVDPAAGVVRVYRPARRRKSLDQVTSTFPTSDATQRRSSRVVKFKIPLDHRRTDDMTAVRDPNDVSGIIKDVVGDLYDMQSKTHGFIPETTDLLVDRIGELTEKLAHLKEQTDPSRAPSNPIHKVSIAPEIVDYVDDGRNPDIFTREFVENVQRGNAVINGKKQAFRDFSVILAQKMKERLKGVDEGVDMVMRNAGLQDELAKAEKEARERRAKDSS